MAVLAAALPYIALAGTVVSAVGAKASAANTAAQETAAGEAAKATSQRVAYNQGRNTAYVESRAKAYAAASGGSSTDPSVVTDLAQIGSQGEYQRLSALYSGDTSAAGDQLEANAATSEGNSKAISTVLSGASSLASKYWTTPPPAAPAAPAAQAA